MRQPPATRLVTVIVATAVLTAALTTLALVLIDPGGDDGGPAGGQAGSRSEGHEERGGAGAQHGPGSTPGDAMKVDSDAPLGAPMHWLPDEEWVRQRWLPFAMADLYRITRTNTEELRSWMRRDSLTAFVESKGLDPERVQEQLMGRVRRDFPDDESTHRELASRTGRVFDQRHLFQHLLMHGNHTKAFGQSVQDALGVGWPRIYEMKREGLDFRAMAERQGRDPDEAVEQVRSALRAAVTEGRRKRALTELQAATMLRPLDRLAAHLFVPESEWQNNPPGVGPNGDMDDWLRRS